MSENLGTRESSLNSPVNQNNNTLRTQEGNSDNVITLTPTKIIDEGNDDDNYAFSVVTRQGSLNPQVDSPINLVNPSSSNFPTTVVDTFDNSDDEETAAYSQIIYNEEDQISSDSEAIIKDANIEDKDLETGASQSETLSDVSNENNIIAEQSSTLFESVVVVEHKDSFKTELEESTSDYAVSSIIINKSNDSSSSLNIVPEEMPKYMKHLDEDQTQLKWQQHQKHIFILSEAGKPIFARYGDENQLNTILSFFLGIVTIVSKEGGTVRTVNCGDLRFIYVLKGALYLVSACRTSESNIEIAKQLETIYEQLVFILTSKNIQDILQKRSNFDLRNLLGGTDKIIYSLINRMSNSIDFSFDSTHVLRLPKNTRNQIGDIMMKNRVQNKLMFSLMICDNTLVHMIRNKKYNMKTKDLLLLMNFVGSAHSSMKSSETWTPICLPGLSETAYVYAYIIYFTENWCYVMICMSTESFFDCQQSQTQTLHDLIQSECFPSVVNASKSPYPPVNEVFTNIRQTASSPTADDFLMTQTFLRHFNCRVKSTTISICQTCSTKFLPPYHTKKERKRLLRLYKSTREKLEEIPNKNIGSQVRTYVESTKYESVIGLWTGNLEIYATFSLLATKSDMIAICEQIKNWIKKEDPSLFLSNIPTF